VKDLPQRRDKALAGIELAEAKRKAIADRYASDGFYVTRCRSRPSASRPSSRSSAAPSTP
jgi:hypothetical protein